MAGEGARGGGGGAGLAARLCGSQWEAEAAGRPWRKWGFELGEVGGFGFQGALNI